MAHENETFLGRWSRLKREERSEEKKLPEKAETEAPPLPPAEELTPESDFTPFMRSDVEPGLRQQALRTLFRDPRFNVMDGLDVYIDDYSKPDPIPAEWLGKLNMMARLGDYHPPEEETPPPEQVATDAEPTQITDQEQQVAGPIAVVPADTSADVLPPPELKQS